MKWTRHGASLAAAAALMFLSVLAPALAQQPATYELRNGWKGTYLSVNGTAVVQSPTSGPAAAWIIEQAGAQGEMRLRSAYTGGYLTLRGGVVQAVPLARDAQNALWVVEATNSNQYARLRNLGQSGAYLNIETGPVQAGTVQPGWVSAFWQAAPYQGNVASAPPPQQPSATRPPQVAGMVTMDILNQSAQPLDIYVDDRAGNVVFISTVPPGYGVAQQSPVGFIWWLSQQDQWMGGYQAGTDAEQLIAYPPS